MTQTVQGPDGRIHNFPDNASPGQIQNAMRQEYGVGEATQAEPQPVEAGFVDPRDLGSVATGANKMIGQTAALPFEATAGLAELTGMNRLVEGLGFKVNRRALFDRAQAYDAIRNTVGETPARPGNLKDRLLQASGAGAAGALMMNPASEALSIPQLSQTSAALGGATSGIGSQLGGDFGSAVSGGNPIATRTGEVIGGLFGGSVVPSTVVGVPSGVRTGVALARPLSQSGRESVVGSILNRAAGRNAATPVEAPLPNVPVTLGQSTNNPGILALEKSVAKGNPDAVGRFKSTLEQGQTGTRQALEGLRGNGAPQVARDFADQQVRNADSAAAVELHGLQSGRTPAQASELARQRIEGIRQAFRDRESELWDNIGANDEGAAVEVDPLRQRLQAYIAEQPRVYDAAIPEDVQAALLRLNPTEPLSEVTPLRTMLRENAQSAGAAGNARMARIYSGLEHTVGTYLDNLHFQDEGVQARYQQARDFSRNRADIFNRQDQVRGTLGTDKFGGDKTSASETLGNFIQPGPAGRDQLRQLLRVDGGPEMQSLIADQIVASLPEGTNQARTWLQRYGSALDELPQLRTQLQRVVDRREAAAALRESPIGLFAGVKPEVGINRLIAHPDSLNVVRQLRHQTQGRPGAWDGIRAAYADEISRRVSSLVERDSEGQPVLSTGRVRAFVRDHGPLSAEFFGAPGRQTLNNIAEAVQMITRTSRGGYPGGSDTATMLSGDRFIDRILDAAMHEHAPKAAAVVGFAKGGPVGAALGYGGAVAARSAFTNARQQIDHLLSEALLNPELGRALMTRATSQNLKVLPRNVRQYLQQFVVGSAGGVVGASAISGNEKRQSP